jgi:DNA-binding winged helix-turn-helix (wHTH) protein
VFSQGFGNLETRVLAEPRTGGRRLSNVDARVRLRFGDCVFDPAARELWRSGRRVRVPPKAFELLAVLLQNRPQPLAQARLRDALWPDAHVGYTSLARVVSEVRLAVGDTARGARLIRTVPCFGYAFAAPVVVEAGSEAEAPACALVAGDREFRLPEGETLVGRSPECGLRLSSAQVSRVHAHLQVSGQRATVEDRHSKNGTWVNEARILDRVELQDGDEVVFGTYRAVFRPSGPLGSTRTGTPR